MFEIFLSIKAKKEFNKLGKNYQKQVRKVLKILFIDPIPARFCDVKKLSGLKDTFRIRIGKIRIVYRIVWKEEDIVISRITFRGKVYN